MVAFPCLTQVQACAKLAKRVIHAWPVVELAKACYYACRRAVLSKSRTEQMVDRLRELQASSPDIEASAIVSVDGLSIASALPQGVDWARFLC